MQAVILRSTIAKQSTAPASTLADKYKVQVAAGTYKIDKWDWAPNNHQRITFNQKLNGYQTWLLWGDDVVCEGEKQDILLQVPYMSQRDNQYQPERTCNTSACCMAAEFLKPGCCHKSDDWFWANCVNPEGDSTDHSAMERALKRVGIKSSFKYDLDYMDLDRELEAGRPIVLGLLHRGSLANPTGGHMVVCIGRYADGYIFNDSWGLGFSYDSNNGGSVKYPRASLDARWLTNTPKSGWGRIFA